MKFGVMVDPHVNKWDIIQQAEQQGYHRAWVPDSEMIWSDCYAVLALAAVNTSRIKLGTGMTTPGTRIAPVTAHSIGSINQLAPGRTFLGVATGHTAMRLIGQPPMKPKELREYVHVVSALLRGEEVEYTLRGRTAEIQFMQQDRNYVNLKDPIPIYIAANGPLALSIAGEMADGWMLAGKGGNEIQFGLGQIAAAAEKTGRKLEGNFLKFVTTSACVLKPGEKLTSERVVNQTGSLVTTFLHFNYEIWEQFGRKDELILPEFADIWEDYLRRVESVNQPPEKRFRNVHEGHATFLQEHERKYITPKAIQASCLAGEPDDIVEQIRALEKAGIDEIALLPPADHARDVFRDFAEQVMPTFR